MPAIAAMTMSSMGCTLRSEAMRAQPNRAMLTQKRYVSSGVEKFSLFMSSNAAEAIKPTTTGRNTVKEDVM